MNQPPRARTSRRSRPSLAAFTDSGYEPSCPPTHSRKSPLLGRSSFTRNTNVLDELDREFKSQLLTDIFTDPASSHNPVSYRGPPMNHTMRSTPSPLPSDAEPAVGSISSSCGGRGGGGTITANSNSNGYGYGRSNSSVYPRSISRSGTISSAWSGVSSRLFMDSTLGGGPADARQSNDFTVQFDRLAKKHGIQPFPHGCKGEPAVSSTPRDPSSGESAPALSGSRFWNRLLGRTPSTVDAPKLPGSAKLTRRHPTVSDLAAIGRGKRDSLRGMHLEHMIRLGGVAIFNLPLGLAPGDLLIPTCIHAAAQFLLNNGLRTPGIFRVSGNLNTVYALYDFYQKQLEENNNEAVVATTALARLPNHIHYSIHDVAHLFRKLLHGLPGGLLGSPSVFQALYNIQRFVYPDPSLSDKISRKVKPRMIALALSSVNLHFRIALICAVFGLLRAINLASEEQEAETTVKGPHEMFAQIKEDALGIVFGPLLLGDKSDHILTDDSEARSGLLVLPAAVDPAAAAQAVSRGKNKSRMDLGYGKKQLERTRRAAMVCQMLIDHWEDVCHQMKRIDTLGATAQAYDLPAHSGGEFRHLSEESKKGAMPEDNARQQTIRSRSGAAVAGARGSSGTRRSHLTPPLLPPPPQPVDDYHHRHHHHHDVERKRHSIHGYHVPSLHGHAPNTSDLTNLMRFSTRGSNSHDADADQTPVPLVAQRPLPEMTPIVEMTPSRSLRSATSPQETPNWRLLSPTEAGPETSPNWRIVAPGQMSEPQTPTRRYDIHIQEPVMDQISFDRLSLDHQSVELPPPRAVAAAAVNERSVSSSSRASSRLFGPSSSPPIEVMAHPAIRPRRELAPPFEESPRVDDHGQADRDELHEPLTPDSPGPSAYGRRAISPVFESSPESVIARPAAARAVSAATSDTTVTTATTATPTAPQEPESRPITPKPLSFKKKNGPSFSIFEDRGVDKTPRAQQLPAASPILSLAKPNSRGEIKLSMKGLKSSPARPPPASPARPQSVPLQPATPNRRPRASTLESDFEDRSLWEDGDTPSPRKLRGNSALYAEIRRLQRLVDAKAEEAVSARKELELAKSMANAGTLSHLVRETQEELKVWKNRAEWAEKQLRERGIATRPGTVAVRGHAHRYSVS